MKNFPALFLVLISLFSAAAFPAQAEFFVNDPPKAIRVTPPAPVFTDAERQTELKRRRDAAIEKMADNSVMILMSAEPKLYTNDVDYPYRQENNLYYLTALKQQDITLVLTKQGGKTGEYLFLRKRNPVMETWNGRMYSDEDAKRISGIQNVANAGMLDDFLNSLKGKEAFKFEFGAAIPANFENLYLLLPNHGFDHNGMREFGREYKTAQSFADVTLNENTNQYSYKPTAGYEIKNAQPIFTELRLVKSPYEIKIMQHAIDITTEALMRAMATAGKANWEYEVQAEVEYIFRKRNADFWGYPSIVGCGENATTLHYTESQGKVENGKVLLMDVGAEYDHYTADITRSFPVSGTFTKEQRELYQIVYDAQEAAAAKIKPGARYGQPAEAARQTVDAGLAKLGLITAPGAVIPGTNTPQSFMWYMHGWGHWLGMNVHDVGGGGMTVLKPGMIMTNEPGIYIRPDALDYMADTPEVRAFIEKIRPAFEKYKGIGIRIEDDMLVTETGVEWMSKNLPRKADDIEAFMKTASKDFVAR